MIESRRVPWNSVTFELDSNGKVLKIHWACPYCHKTNEDFNCSCGAKIPDMEIQKDYNLPFPGRLY